MFDGEHGILLQAMQGNQASSHGEGDVSWFSLIFIGNLGYILTKQLAWPVKIRVSSVKSRLLSSCEGHLGILL